jgi:hypothetical protein
MMMLTSLHLDHKFQFFKGLDELSNVGCSRE